MAVRSHLERKAKTTAGIHKINQSDLATTPIPLPPDVEQGRLIDVFTRLDSITCALRSEVERLEVRLRRLRQSILKWAFEGKLVDQDPNDEPASVLLERIKAEREAAGPGKPRRGRRRSRRPEPQAELFE